MVHSSMCIVSCLFLVLMIDINKDILQATIGSFADETRLWYKIVNLLSTNELQEDLLKVS